MPQADDALSDFDVTRPHIARIYDYWLGGKDNFEVDREAAELAVATKAEESLTKSMGQKVTFRTHDEVAAFFAGLELLAPGVVPVQSWRATAELDINSAPTAMWGGVGYKG